MENHRDLVMFLSPKDDEFKRVAGHLKLMADKALAKVQENWQTEENIEAGE